MTEIDLEDLNSLVSEYVSAAIPRIARSQDDTTLLAIEVANLLKEENVEEVVANTQKVMEI